VRALISVFDKSGVIDFARQLVDAGVEIVSTGGTLAALDEAGIPVRSVSDATGFPEILDGRVKTLHPRIHAGILARRDREDHMQTLREQQIEAIDIIVCNLYPFAETVRSHDTTLEEALEQIDIGGPAMIRAAAKNFPSVIALADPADYQHVAEIVARSGVEGLDSARRRALAAKAFGHVAAYDAMVASYLGEDLFPEKLIISARKLAELRYGENPHQGAALYEREDIAGKTGVAAWTQRHGPEMSYNNYLDASAAWHVVQDFAEPAAAIIKHNAPCGVARDAAIARAFERALAGDPVSAFGGVIAVNRPVDLELAEIIARDRYDVLIAPGYEDDGLARLVRRASVRCLQTRPDPTSRLDVRVLAGALLVQEHDDSAPDPASWQVVTQREPETAELRDLEFAWRVVKHVRSNAIILAVDGATVGIGGGQPNRVDAVRIAVDRAGERARGSVLASDAFFPFADGVEVAAAAGVRAIAQPGGSRRDAAIIEVAEQAGIAMVFTGKRHFRH
jgi:phosphoribosylaminoimidazolecarboxamide formyltransferase / IMP cyclohydrolase